MIFANGPNLVFLGEPRKDVVIVGYDINELEQTIGLRFSETGAAFLPSMLKWTGYIFSVDDFDPNPTKVNWSNIGPLGTIVCTKSIDGKTDWHKETLQAQKDEIRMLNEQIEIRDTKMASDLLNLQKKSQLLNQDSYSILEHAKILGSIKTLAEVPEVRMFRGMRNPASAMSQLMATEGGQ